MIFGCFLKMIYGFWNNLTVFEKKMKFSESWLREWVNPNCSVEQLCHFLTMAGLEVEHCDSSLVSPVIEINITPNRGDCLSIKGIARDLAACTHTVYQMPFNIVETPPNRVPQPTVKIEFDTLEICPKYFGRVIQNVNLTCPTPDWMQARLIASGLKTHNCIVDIMNYVMLELGQPMHAFDLDKIDGHTPNKIVVIRKAKSGETLLTLDNQMLELTPANCVIADSEKSLALAGVMGGLESGVSMQTQSVFLESAFFNPLALAGVARNFGLQSDSAFRFERGVDFNLPLEAIHRATQLILQIAGGEAGFIIEAGDLSYLPKVSYINLNYQTILKLLGQEISIEQITDILTSLGCEVTRSEFLNQNCSWQVQPPSYRFDLNIEVDLIEEIARVVGYDNLSMKMPHFTVNQNIINTNCVPLSRLKRALVDVGYTEAVTYSFVSPAHQALCTPELENLILENPISSEMSVMRTSLWPGLIGALKYNQARSRSTIQLFESGLRFRLINKQLIQERVLSGIAVGQAEAIHWKKKSNLLDFYDVKGHIESIFELTGYEAGDLKWETCSDCALHPGQSAQLSYKSKNLGLMGVLHPKIAQSLSLDGSVIVFELLLEDFSKMKDFQFHSPSKYPSISRDLSFTLNIDQVIGDLVEFIKNNLGKLLQKVVVFDIYSGKGIDVGRKSVAISLTFQHAQRTLVENEIENLMQTMIRDLQSKFNAQLRE